MAGREGPIAPAAVMLGFGLVTAPVAYFVLGDSALTAVGIALVAAGLSLLTYEWRPFDEKTLRDFVLDAVSNIEEVLEEFDVRSRAVYVYDGDRGMTYALVPVLGTLASASTPKQLRLVVDVGGTKALTLFPPGSRLLTRLGVAPGADPEDSAKLLLCDTLGLASSITLTVEGDRAVAEVSKPVRLPTFRYFERVMGSVQGCLIALTLATCLGRGVRIVAEEDRGRSRIVVMEVL